MFRSQLIKCYELPYCSLEILTQNRFRLLIESFNQESEPVFQLEGHISGLRSLTQAVKEQLQSATPPVCQQREKQAVYPVHCVIEDQSYSAQLSWGQLSDLAKILEQYQTDVAKYPLFNGKRQKYLIGFIAFLVMVMGGMIARVRMSPQSLKTNIQSPESSEKTTSSSPLSLETTPTLSPLKHSQKPQLKLSDSLEKLDRLSPPSSIAPPSPIAVNLPSPPQPQPIPDPISPPSQPEFQNPEFPSRKQVNFPAKPQPKALFEPTPQLREIRTYFQSRWQPPSHLKQDLEYQMTISANGSVQQIIPLGTLSESHFSQVPFPKVNQRFVSASATQSPQKIRLIFRPSGEIKTFLIHQN